MEAMLQSFGLKGGRKSMQGCALVILPFIHSLEDPASVLGVRLILDHLLLSIY